MKVEDFHKVSICQRCGRGLIMGKKVSWFNEEVICLYCASKEDELKARLKITGQNLHQFEGCGYLPDL